MAPFWSFLLFLELVVLSSICSTLVGVSAQATPWTHDWSNIGAALFTDYSSPSLLTDEQVEFLASNYAIVSLEKCTGSGAGLKTEEGIYLTASRLKQANPNLKVLFYWSMKQAGISCYAAYSELEANPQWYLRDDSGNIVTDGTQPVVDFTQADVRAWWLQVPFTWSNASSIIDGILADGSGAVIWTNINEFNEWNGQVIGNGIAEYPQFPDHEMDGLPYMGGIMAEHFAVFESVLGDGSLNVSMVDNLINLVSKAAGMNKTVVVNIWPGPCVTPIDDLGPSWPQGNQPVNASGRAQALLDHVNFTMAAYLTMAQPNIFFQYQWWYSSDNGMMPCEGDDDCEFPTGFYPWYRLPLGPPKGPYTMVNYVYTREFEFATSYLDLNNPAQSYVSFKNNKN